ncbi:MAG: addiction module RelE/StbE family toxin [Flavobacteriales bacterium]|jgi:toxin ParE1/3/4
MVQINWSRQAASDLKDIFEYISLDSKRYAQIQVIRIKSRTKLLTNDPDAGRLVPELNSSSIRELIEGNYRIIYKGISENEIAILTVHHSSRKFN